MRGRTISVYFRGAFAALITVAGIACGSSPITSARIEGAIAPTFANLLHVQIAWLGLPPVQPSDITVTASCRREVVGGGTAGSGQWICTLLWQVPNRESLRDEYDVLVTTDGCYTATVDGAQLGGPTLKSSNGADVRNLLYAFEGCFDTT